MESKDYNIDGLVQFWHWNLYNFYVFKFAKMYHIKIFVSVLKINWYQIKAALVSIKKLNRFHPFLIIASLNEIMTKNQKLCKWSELLPINLF